METLEERVNKFDIQLIQVCIERDRREVNAFFYTWDVISQFRESVSKDEK